MIESAFGEKKFKKNTDRNKSRSKKKDNEHKNETPEVTFDKKTPDQKKRYADRQKQVDLAKLRNEKHIGANFKSNKK